MRIVLLGPAGAGKGTQAERLQERLGVPHVSTGEMLRSAALAGTEIGLEAEKYMSAGTLVPDDVIVGVVEEWLGTDAAARGFVFDGFPRTIVQAEALERILKDAGLELDHVVGVEVPDEIIVQRLAGRRSCPRCGRTYHVEPGEADMVCAVDGTPLILRPDDDPVVIAKRLKIYRDLTGPLVDFYESRGLLRRVDGLGELDEVEARIMKAIS